ncbi:MAG: CHAT domain-containing protein [Candidatus Competibacteraceae bacterium]
MLTTNQLSLIALILLLGLPVATWPQATPSQQDLKELVSDFDRSGTPLDWVADNRARLTPEVIEGLNSLANEAYQGGGKRFALTTRWLLAFAAREQGDQKKAMEQRIKTLDIGFDLADTNEAYLAIYRDAREVAPQALKIGSKNLAFAALTIAADSAYFATKLDGLAHDQVTEWQSHALETIEQAAALAPETTNPVWLEHFVSLTGGILGDALSRMFYGGDLETRRKALETLAPRLEVAIPVDFRYRHLPDKSLDHEIALAENLASLSYEHGNPQSASARLAFAAERALAADEVKSWANLLFQRYQGERDHAGAKTNLIQLRQDIYQRLPQIRARFLSRPGRLLAAMQADEIVAKLLRDEISEGNPPFEHLFQNIERLKARFLLDQLTIPFTTPPRDEQSAKLESLERLALGFPNCKGESQNLLTRELLLVSRLPIGLTLDRERQVSAIAELESVYRERHLGFSGQATIPSLAEIQGALHGDEAIIEYFIPYHPLHPAMEIWILMITKDNAAIRRSVLEHEGNFESGFVGSISVDGCPPMDASPLGDAVATVRTAIQDSDEKEALRSLAQLHHLLIDPVIDAGLAPEKFRRWIIVPHGPLHYLPFAALRPEGGKFLIERVAITINPSTSVWFHNQASTPNNPKRALALLAPDLQSGDLPPLPGSAQEATALTQAFAGPDALRLLRGKEATESALRERVSLADVIHLSTHGNFPQRDAIDFHEILLTPAGGDDGHLTAREIRALDLSRASTVVLAICNGGLYNIGPSDEPYGLVPAFLVAGSDTVIATLWPLNDGSGQTFVSELYKTLPAKGAAEAIRRVAVGFIEEEQLIRRWAAFISIGPGRGFPSAAAQVSIP